MSEQIITPVEVVDQGPVYVYLRRLRAMRVRQAQLEEAIKETSRMLVNMMGEEEVAFTDPDGNVLVATAVRPDERVKVDLHALAEIDPELYRRVTKPVLDSAKLKNAFKAGLVSPEATAAMTTTPSTAYVRIAAADETEDDDG